MVDPPKARAHQGAYPSCLVEQPSAKRNQRDDLRGVWGRSCAWVTPTVVLCPCLCLALLFVLLHGAKSRRQRNGRQPGNTAGLRENTMRRWFG
jgi:hypothetical protein